MSGGSALGVPAEVAFGSDNDIVEKREDDDADFHFSGVQIDTAIVLVLLIIESHGVAFFDEGFMGSGQIPYCHFI
ncbi:MAG: hypothetical protein EHM85_19050 [Desulfobacteraceae bacterium]|nr:MAG: hypothetical protein EHM85_19050 [Desulfobacteraceae bacterium]